MIIYVPIENLEQRYSKMQNNIVKSYVDMFIHPDMGEFSDIIEVGQFLDINKTNIFKAKQLQEIALLFHKGQITYGTIFWVADIFFPGIEMIRYMADLQHIKVFIFGFNHAGRADETDFVQQLKPWSDICEKGYHAVCDGIFVGSQFHKERVVKYFNYPADKVHVVGGLWELQEVYKVYSGGDKKQDFIIFPHRLTKEKGINDLLQFAAKTSKSIVVTTCGHKETVTLPKNVKYLWSLTKLQYYHIMSQAKWYLSLAQQETFGYTLQEAIAFGCEILVPNRACYPEMVPALNLFNSIDEIDSKFDSTDLKIPMEYTQRWSGNIKNYLKIMEEECGKGLL